MTLSLGNRGQHRVERGFGILQLHSHSDNLNWLQRLQMRTEIHCVLFRGNECRSFRLLAQSPQLVNIRIAVAMMIAKAVRASEYNLRRFQLREEIVRAGDAAEREAWLGGFRRHDVTMHAPHELIPKVQSVSR